MTLRVNGVAAYQSIPRHPETIFLPSLGTTLGPAMSTIRITIARDFRNLNLANRITILRMLCVPAVVGLLLYYAQSGKRVSYSDALRIATAASFGAVFLLDMLDGFIARVFNQKTKLGALLDPVADKAVMIPTLIAMGNMPLGAFTNDLPSWFIIVTVSRDIILIIGTVLIFTLRDKLDATPHMTGKFATFFNAAVIECTLLNLPSSLFWVLIGAAVACSVVSGVQYVIDGVLQLHATSPGNGPRSGEPTG
jgi:cardiolipin synthase (CMP-forming)